MSTVRIVRHHGYYDGPLNGICEIGGERFWFDVEDAEERSYVVRRPTAALLAESDRRHDLFRKHVGHHTDYDESGRRDVGALCPQSEWRHYYDAAKAWPKIGWETCPVVGRFTARDKVLVTGPQDAFGPRIEPQEHEVMPAEPEPEALPPGEYTVE